MRMLTTAIAFLGATLAAHAADLTVKAPQSPFTTNTASGFYWGIGASAGIDQTSASATNLFATSLFSSGLAATGGSVDVEAGYIWGNASLAGFGNWARIYASGSYQNISAGNADVSVASRWSAMQGVDINADIVSTILSTIQVQNPFPAYTPQPPSNIAVASTPRQYLGAFIDEFGIDGTIGAANGVAVGIAPGIRTGWLWQTINTATGKPNGNAIDMGIAVDWPLRGVTFNNVFAANGAPLTTSPALDLGTQYKVYIRYDF